MRQTYEEDEILPLGIEFFDEPDPRTVMHDVVNPYLFESSKVVIGRPK
jgi:hypothetical protein